MHVLASRRHEMVMAGHGKCCSGVGSVCEGADCQSAQSRTDPASRHLATGDLIGQLQLWDLERPESPWPPHRRTPML